MREIDIKTDGTAKGTSVINQAGTELSIIAVSDLRSTPYKQGDVCGELRTLTISFFVPDAQIPPAQI